MAASPQKFIIQSHGSRPTVIKSFPVPNTIRLHFFYDPMRNDIGVLNTPILSSYICAGNVHIAMTYKPDEICPVNLTLTRADDLGFYTGVLHCNTKTWSEIPNLGPVVVSPPSKSPPMASLFETLDYISTFIPVGTVADVYVLACGYSTDIPRRPDTTFMIDPISNIVITVNTWKQIMPYVPCNYDISRALHIYNTVEPYILRGYSIPNTLYIYSWLEQGYTPEEVDFILRLFSEGQPLEIAFAAVKARRLAASIPGSAGAGRGGYSKRHHKKNRFKKIGRTFTRIYNRPHSNVRHRNTRRRN